MTGRLSGRGPLPAARREPSARHLFADVDEGEHRGPFRARGKLVDPVVIRAAQRGDTRAMNELLNSLEPFVAMVCGPIAGTDSADATQETLLAVFRHLGRLHRPEALAGWVRVIATREAVRMAQRRGCELVLGSMPEPPQQGDHELGADIARVLEVLAPQHRAVLVLRAQLGLDSVTIASLLNIPTGTVRSRLSRARSQFRREWQAR